MYVAWDTFSPQLFILIIKNTHCLDYSNPLVQCIVIIKKINVQLYFDKWNNLEYKHSSMLIKISSKILLNYKLVLYTFGSLLATLLIYPKFLLEIFAEH